MVVEVEVEVEEVEEVEVVEEVMGSGLPLL